MLGNGVKNRGKYGTVLVAAATGTSESKSRGITSQSSNYSLANTLLSDIIAHPLYPSHNSPSLKSTHMSTLSTPTPGPQSTAWGKQPALQLGSINSWSPLPPGHRDGWPGPSFSPYRALSHCLQRLSEHHGLYYHPQTSSLATYPSPDFTEKEKPTGSNIP